MVDASSEMLNIHVNVQITATALQAIVANAKQLAGKDADGVYRVDTADQVSNMITSFLAEEDFESYVRDINNYQLPVS